MKLNNKGFTLVELMISVAIIGTLGAIAYPSYTAYTATSKRSDAIVALATIALRLEEYYLNNNGYTGATVSGLFGSTISEKKYYDLTLTGADDFTYLLTAKPRSPHSDSECGSLTLDSIGTKGATSAGSPAAKADCWK